MNALLAKQIADLSIRIGQLDAAAAAVTRRLSDTYSTVDRPGRVMGCLIAERNRCASEINSIIQCNPAGGRT